MFFSVWNGLFAIISGIYAFTFLHDRRRQRPPLPPGPRRIPIIGNLLDLPGPDQQDWIYWLKYKDRYGEARTVLRLNYERMLILFETGPISSLNVLGAEIIIVNDARVAVELLEKRSRIYSSRPRQKFLDMSGWSKVLGAMNDPDRFRKTRKHFHQEIGSNISVASFDHVQLTETSHFLLRIMNEPEKLQEHIRKEAGGIILKIAYGYIIEAHDRDPLIDLINTAMADFGQAMLAMTWMVDFIPIPWLPGAGFISTAKEFETRSKAVSDVPYNFVKRQMKSGHLIPSFLSNALKESSVEPGSEEEDIIKWSAASLYGGGADTTVSSIANFFLAMALFPEVQHKAQQEIDKVVESGQMPQFRDRENLPYVNAVVKEVLRWHPVVPINVVHTSTQDDTFEGYFIPKGSSVITNLWAFTHDENVYHDPMAFKPERFLATDGHVPERDPHMLVFGFGRRICPGRNLADSNVFLSIAQSLTVFEISKPIRDGKLQDIPIKFLPGVISHPAPFELSIKPRSEKHRELVQSLEQLYPWEKSHGDLLSGVPAGTNRMEMGQQ
ncbi:hypothetical protein N7532_003566 [Penicillium argentinense]|uniref:Cytochrome P450 n=1 Tax=Penicillium argentinense TaxID=1131581 RepID=A0A9W9KFB7_9EURO|nr:uncharacterized protein N7532_003566 [Penicillium argentinense]KAJ5103037.1 hypothetical protein N7532_003566 [Penicillium argentinense]